MRVIEGDIFYMSTAAKSENIKVQSTIDWITSKAIDQMVEIGVKGSNRAEVIAFLLKNWVENEFVHDLEKYETLCLKMRIKPYSTSGSDELEVDK